MPWSDNHVVTRKPDPVMTSSRSCVRDLTNVNERQCNLSVLRPDPFTASLNCLSLFCLQISGTWLPRKKKIDKDMTCTQLLFKAEINIEFNVNIFFLYMDIKCIGHRKQNKPCSTTGITVQIKKPRHKSLYILSECLNRFNKWTCRGMGRSEALT